MKLMRVGPAGRETPALLDADGVLRDLSPAISDIDAALLADPGGLTRLSPDSLPVLDSAKLAVDGGMQGLRLRAESAGSTT
ncbi:MAG TPA: hypothetical protein VGD53_32585 [Actinoallomurus sp.]|jgi:hypothetical protein